MNIKVKILLSILTITILNNSCTLIRKTRNNNTINFIKSDPAFIKDCAGYCILINLDIKKSSFGLKDITDKKIKSKITTLGNEITVIYKQEYNGTDPDSTVIFSSFSILMGYTDIIYDFAYHQRTFPNKGTRKADYYFVKVAERIYYRKRPMPMM